MSCDVAAAAFLLFASTNAVAARRAVLTPAVGRFAPTRSLRRAAVSRHRPIAPFHPTEIGEVDGYRKSIAAAPAPVALPQFDAFSSQIGELSALDEKGHIELMAGNYVGDLADLKCILHGISQDLTKKLNAVSTAQTGHDEDMALRDMRYLLNDNVEVIDPPKHPAG